MKKIYSLLVAMATTTVMYAQTTITQWNFDGNTNDATTGSGTAEIVGATGTPTFQAGNPSSGRSWRVSGFPAQGSGSGTAGFMFAASTESYTGIMVSADITGTNTGSRYFQMQYTVNGSTWNDVGDVIVIGPTSTSGWTSVNNSIPQEANNNTNFAMRLVSVFDPENNNAFKAIGTTSTYSVGGAIRVDNITISGTRPTLSISDINNEKPSFIKNTFVKNGEIIFGVQAKDVKVYNMYGQVVKKASVKINETLDVSELQKGNYIVTGIVNNIPVFKKILKD
ncbi:T9SS type A sorting domain-containing protein [Chryseobacterium paridis]|uniref:T9SS type A sorting domain-containing protein n=1 Tax=Chryseobacterium paridis TaxID=2800328 RepID=A0ABS1FZU9_9FLAO|nr:T9SS type A sorting domain-containing protein [Chryseobacterium paridis]MBK1897937.1 T9SS type A sorting domain-containing protein [Chryseobacterium paridis]